MLRSQVQHFFDPDTFTLSYVVTDTHSNHCVIIDPILNYYPESGKISEHSIHTIITYIKEHKLQPKYILETHIHADHISGAQILKKTFDVPIAMGAHVKQVQDYFNALYHLEDDCGTAMDFDFLLKNDDTLTLGDLDIIGIETPGHTPACMSYCIGNHVFVGDTLFMPDYGTARCDFPNGDAATLFDSIQKLLSLPEQTQLMMCHDYMPEGRDLAWETTVAEQKLKNIHVHDGINKEQFIKLRISRDKQLSTPKLLLPAIQMNIRAGKLPQAAMNGVRYLKIPLNQL